VYELQFSTLRMSHSSVIDVDSEEKALAVVVAHTVRRPYSQTLFARLREERGLDGRRTVEAQSSRRVNLDAPICAIDFHSYSLTSAKVSASLKELAGAYYQAFDALESGQLATVDIRQ
jgi:hypothetical protein